MAWILVADLEAADAAILAVLKDWSAKWLPVPSEPVLMEALMRAVIAHLEPHARFMKVFATLPGRRGFRPSLLPAVWSLKYKERLVLSLIYVEQFSADQAAQIAGMQKANIEIHAANALAKLEHLRLTERE
jgi:DNA-directed RNA polymerase specialized sigma24 family protein